MANNELHDPDLKMCRECGEELPATSHYFDADKRKDDGLRTICKACRSKERELAQNKKIDDRIKQLDNASMVMLESLTKGGSSVPHMAELYQKIMEAFEGAGGFAAHFMAQYLMAKPGSSVRTKMLQTIMGLGREVTNMGLTQVPVEIMEDEDLQLVFKKLAQGGEVLRIDHDDGQAAQDD